MSDDVLSGFIEEAAELLEEAEKALLNLEKEGQFSTCYNDLFRCLHSLKGSSSMMGLKDLEVYVHKLEDFLKQFESSEKLQDSIIDFFFKGIDDIRSLLAGKKVEYVDYESTSTVKREKQDQELEQVKSNILNLKKERETICVIDDEEELTDLLQMTIEDLGYDVEVFNDPLKFLEYFDEHHPSLILSDYNMPNMNGLDLFIECRKKRPFVPFIMLSGYFTVNICIILMANGVTAVAEKPFNINVISKLIDKALVNYRCFQIMEKSLSLMKSHYPKIDDFLKSSNMEHLQESFKKEMMELWVAHKELIKAA